MRTMTPQDVVEITRANRQKAGRYVVDGGGKTIVYSKATGEAELVWPADALEMETNGTHTVNLSPDASVPTQASNVPLSDAAREREARIAAEERVAQLEARLAAAGKKQQEPAKV